MPNPFFQRFDYFVSLIRLESVEIGRREGGSGGVVGDAGQIFVCAFTRPEKWAKVLLP